MIIFHYNAPVLKEHFHLQHTYLEQAETLCDTDRTTHLPDAMHA